MNSNLNKALNQLAKIYFVAKDTTDKINEILDEAEDRIAAVVKESKDVTKAIKEVGNQIGDIPKAAAGKKRSGRKQK